MFWKRKRFEDDLICPACLTVYRYSEIPPDRPTCPECGSEAMDIDVTCYRQFLEAAPLADLERRREAIRSTNELVPDFRRHLIRQIERLIKEKKRARRTNKKVEE